MDTPPATTEMGSRRPRPEVWGGIECTVNRVGDLYFDQLERNGHARRADDLDLIAGLGLRTLRYPILWERIAPDGISNADWSWPDTRLERLRNLGINPIVGFVHHGSGPRYTSLVDPDFPEKLAEFAAAFALRYPWVDRYTPVNEPLTTARFSGLYGHWYPHGRNGAIFLRALLGECRGIVLSMDAVRRANPQAQLIQTEDLGKTFSTPLLSYQAAFENERRWLTYDLLCAKVDDDHPLRSYLKCEGVADREIEWFLDHPSPPDILGINHYVTSERFLDEELRHYPAGTHGGNGRHRYADVEAARVLADGPAGLRVLLREAWERYEIPIAITEIHLGGHREEQLRWLYEAWESTRDLMAEGVDIRAITGWSLLGTYDWNNLLTRSDGEYEPGAFDLRSGFPRPTAIAGMLCDLAEGREPSHPVLGDRGWWRRHERLIYPSYSSPAIRASHACSKKGLGRERRPILVVGSGGLGKAFGGICSNRALDALVLTCDELEANSVEVGAMLDELRPWGIINASISRGTRQKVVAGESPRASISGKRELAPLLAHECVARGIHLVSFTDDEEAPNPMPGELIVRTGTLFGIWDEENFILQTLRALAAGERVVATDGTIHVSYLPDLVNATLDLLVDGEQGLWQLTNGEATTWYDLSLRIAALAGLDPGRIEAIRILRNLDRDSSSGAHGTILPALDDALIRYLSECKAAPPEQPEGQLSAQEEENCPPRQAERNMVHNRTSNHAMPAPLSVGSATSVGRGLYPESLRLSAGERFRIQP